MRLSNFLKRARNMPIEIRRSILQRARDKGYTHDVATDMLKLHSVTGKMPNLSQVKLDIEQLKDEDYLGYTPSGRMYLTPKGKSELSKLEREFD